MAEDWKSLQAQITADLKKDGIEFFIRRKSEAKFDAIAGQYLPPVISEPTEFTAYGIFKSVGGNSLVSSGYMFAWQEGTTIQRGDKIVLLDCSTYIPQLEDEFVFEDGIGEQIWKVKAWAFLQPGFVELLQYALLRRA